MWHKHPTPDTSQNRGYSLSISTTTTTTTTTRVETFNSNTKITFKLHTKSFIISCNKIYLFLKTKNFMNFMNCYFTDEYNCIIVETSEIKIF